MPHTFEDLTRRSRGELNRLWREGTAPAPAELAGSVYRGRNTALLARLAGNGPFAKGFFKTDRGVEGCNFPVRVRGDDWTVDTARPFGFFRVEATEGGGANDRAPRTAVLVDYGLGRPGPLRAGGPGLGLRVVEWLARPLRDVIVRPAGAADGVLLGRAFFGARARIHVSHFVLQRWRPLAGDDDLNIVLAASAAGRIT